MPALSNPKHEAFCQAYVRGERVGNACGCYKAVYGKDNRQAASRLLHRDDIVRRVADLQAEIATIEQKATDRAIEKLGVDKEWVLSRLVENVERAMQSAPVIGAEGEPTGEYKYDGAVANRALELLGKNVGLFVVLPPPPQSVTVNANVKAELVDRPPRETFKQWEARRAAELAGKAKGKGK